MSPRIGILGAGHLAGYLLEGFQRRGPGQPVLVADPLPGQAEAQARRWGARAMADNQALVDGADLVLLAVRPQDALPACRALAFRPGQVLASAAAGVKLADLAPAVAPARAVRIMPLSSAALNRSPTLLFPGEATAREELGRLGAVIELPDEAAFTAASAIAAFYAWTYALAGAAVAWTEGAGVPPELARTLVLETLRSTAEMGLAHPEQGLQAMLDRLATPGGISELGLGILGRDGGLEAWPRALEAVLERLRS